MSQVTVDAQTMAGPFHGQVHEVDQPRSGPTEVVPRADSDRGGRRGCQISPADADDSRGEIFQPGACRSPLPGDLILGLPGWRNGPHKE